jgi:hypothetical protein
MRKFFATERLESEEDELFLDQMKFLAVRAKGTFLGSHYQWLPRHFLHRRSVLLPK